MKTCLTCEQSLPLEDFYARKDNAGKASSSCKPCTRKRTAQRKKALVKSAPAEGKYSTGKPCRKGHLADRIAATGDCSECYRIRDAERSKARNLLPERVAYYENWVKANPSKVAEAAKRYASSGRGKAAQKLWYRKKYESDPLFKAAAAIRRTLKRVLRSAKASKDGKTFDLLGYGPAELKARMDVQFVRGMSWSNYGLWEIDHKKPVSRFIKQGIFNPALINALSNLQPLWKRDNIRKGAKYAG